MPSYYFHVLDHRKIIDETGTDLPGDHEAKLEAVRLAGALIEESPGDVIDHGQYGVEVEGQNGQTIFSLKIAPVDYR